MGNCIAIQQSLVCYKNKNHNKNHNKTYNNWKKDKEKEMHDKKKEYEEILFYIISELDNLPDDFIKIWGVNKVKRQLYNQYVYPGTLTTEIPEKDWRERYKGVRY